MKTGRHRKDGFLFLPCALKDIDLVNLAQPVYLKAVSDYFFLRLFLNLEPVYGLSQGTQWVKQLGLLEAYIDTARGKVKINRGCPRN